jgi:hypothetical protein
MHPTIMYQLAQAHITDLRRRTQRDTLTHLRRPRRRRRTQPVAPRPLLSASRSLTAEEGP